MKKNILATSAKSNLKKLEKFWKVVKRKKPRKLDLMEIFCEVLYVLKSGCQWRMLPKDFPKWQIIYYYFHIWNENNGEKPSLLELVLKKSGWEGAYK